MSLSTMVSKMDFLKHICLLEFVMFMEHLFLDQSFLFYLMSFSFLRIVTVIF